jgi:hypothetical protein
MNFQGRAFSGRFWAAAKGVKTPASLGTHTAENLAEAWNVQSLYATAILRNGRGYVADVAARIGRSPAKETDKLSHRDSPSYMAHTSTDQIRSAAAKASSLGWIHY